MEISQLRTLLHVAELGSLSKAAERLNIAQPALSRQIRLLEEELGVSLFKRHGRGMVTTEAGKEVLKRAAKAISEFDDIKLIAQDEKMPLSGNVAIGMPPTIGEILSLPLIETLRQKHPQITISLVSAYSGYLFDWLQRGEIDVAILYDLRDSKTLHFTPLLQENLHIVGAAAHKFSNAVPVRFASLQNHMLLMPSRGHGLRDLIDNLALRSGVALTIPIEANALSTLKDLVRHGHGCTILPFAAVQNDVAAGYLTSAPLIEPKPIRNLTLACRQASISDRLVSHAAKAIREVAESLADRSLPGSQF